MAGAGTLTIKFLGDARDFRRVADSLQSKLQSIGSSMRSAGRIMTAGLTVPIVAGFAKAAKEAEEANQVMAQTRAVLKSTGGEAGVTARHVSDLAQAIHQKTLFDDEAIQSGENLLLTFRKVRNEAGKGNDVFDQATKLIADMSTALGTDLKSSALQLGKALNDPTTGLTALRRSGVSFTESQIELIQKLQESGDLLGAQKIILAEVRKEFAGSAQAARKSSGGWEVLMMAVRDLAESIGQAILPIIQRASEFLTRLAQKFQDLSPHMQTLIIIGAAVAAALGPLLIVLGSLVTALGAILSPVGAVVFAIGALAAGFVIAYNKSEAFRETVKGVLDWLSSAFDTVKGAISAFVDVAKALWKRFGDVIVDQVKVAFHFFVEAVRSGFEVVKGIFHVVLGILTLNWREAWQGIKEIVGGIWDGIKNVVHTAFETLRNFLKVGVRAIADTWRTVWGGIKDFMAGLWDGIVGGARLALNGLIRIINGVIHAVNALIHGFNLIPFHSDVPTIPTVPTLARGGEVLKTGLAVVHEGETFSGVGRPGKSEVHIHIDGGTFVGTSPQQLAGLLRDHIESEFYRKLRRSGALSFQS